MFYGGGRREEGGYEIWVAKIKGEKSEDDGLKRKRGQKRCALKGQHYIYMLKRSHAPIPSLLYHLIPTPIYLINK